MANAKKPSAKKLGSKAMKKTKGGALNFAALGYGGASIKGKVVPYGELGYGGSSIVQGPEVGG